MLTENSHLALLFENATEGIVLTDGAGNIIMINPSAERMFGYVSAELKGKPVEILIPAHLKHRHTELRDGFAKHPSNRSMGQNRDLFGQRKDGTDLPVEVSLSHYTQAGQLYVIAFIVDITKRKAAEASMRQKQIELQKISSEMQRLNTELEAKVEERTVILKEALQKLEESQLELSEALEKEKQLGEIKSRFLSMASHEFRTPLSTVLSSASLLSKYTAGEEQDKRDRHIGKIKSSVKHLNDILEDFLSLGKLDEGKIQSNLTDFSLSEFIGETIDEMKGLVKPGQTITYSHSGTDNVISDKKLLKNILINLISNAVKFSPDESVVEINSECKDGNAVIAVTDHGIGISEEDQGHLFSSFFRGANATNIQGTGLGLHIVQRYLGLLGGCVELQSKLNKGTTVTFTIPVN